MPKDTVISFRLNADQVKKLDDVLNTDMPTGVNSPNQQARKIVVDFLEGRINYKNKNHRKRDLEQYPEG